MSDKSREEYEWNVANKDIALTTHLTLMEASSLTWPLRHRTDLHPFDVTPSLTKIVRGLWLTSRSEAEALGEALADLLKAAGNG